MKSKLAPFLLSAALAAAPLEEYAVSGFTARALEGYRKALESASSLEEAELLYFNIGTTFLLQGNPSEALLFLGELSEGRGAPLPINGSIALLREALRLAEENAPALALALNRAAAELAKKAPPSFARLMQRLSEDQEKLWMDESRPLLNQIREGKFSSLAVQRALQEWEGVPKELLAKTLVTEEPLPFLGLALTAYEKGQNPQTLPYPSGKWALEAKLFADLAVAGVQLARAEKMLERPFENLSEVSSSLAERSQSAGTQFLSAYEEDEAAAYRGRICLETVSERVRPLAAEALRVTRAAMTLLEASPRQLMEPQTLLEQAARLYEQIVQQLETIPEETPEEQEKSAEQKVVEMELMDRREQRPAGSLPEVERPW